MGVGVEETQARETTHYHRPGKEIAVAHIAPGQFDGRPQETRPFIHFVELQLPEERRGEDPRQLPWIKAPLLPCLSITNSQLSYISKENNQPKNNNPPGAAQ